jgi:hypothetical protein
MKPAMSLVTVPGIDKYLQVPTIDKEYHHQYRVLSIQHIHFKAYLSWKSSLLGCIETRFKKLD